MPKKILIVDDDSDTVELLTMALTQAGYAVITARNAEQGLQCARASAPDLVLLDLMLPDFNGYTVVEKLRRLSLTARMPVVMMTALPGELPQVVATESGTDAYIRKPFSISSLLSTVADCLRTKAREKTRETAFAV